MITRLDGDVGKLMRLVDDLEMESSTLVIFTSDNGPYQGVPTPVEFFDSNGILRGGKRDNYEGGIRVPFIARWKGQIPAGVTNDKMIAFWDMLPTFADIIDYPDPLKTDGLSMLPDLLGSAGQQHQYLYWDYGHVRDTYSQALRYGDYKILSIVKGDDKRYELYGLREDIGETRDIASKHPDVLDSMKQMLNKAYSYTDNYPRVIHH